MSHEETHNDRETVTTNITVIAFCRPKLLYTMLQALSNNRGVEGTPLYIFIDGAREGEDKQDERDSVAKTIEVANDFEWMGEKKVFASDNNQGMRTTVKSAIDTSLRDFESTIILEDDITTSPFFFDYMKQGLDNFADDSRVGAICSYCYPFSREHFNPTSPYFLKHFCCWGWGTWRRAWEKVCWSSDVLREHLKKKRKYREINLGMGEYVTGILEANHNGYVNTWAVFAGVSFFLNDQHCLYPPETLANNIGWRYDDHSTHTRSHINPNAPLAFLPITIEQDMPVEANMLAWKAYNTLIYPPKEIRKVLKRRVIQFLAPALRPIKRLLVKKK